MRFVDHSKDGIIGEDDRVIIGDPNPDIYGNFNLNFRWRDLELGALFTYSLGNDAIMLCVPTWSRAAVCPTKA